MIAVDSSRIAGSPTRAALGIIPHRTVFQLRPEAQNNVAVDNDIFEVKPALAQSLLGSAIAIALTSIQSMQGVV